MKKTLIAAFAILAFSAGCSSEPAPNPIPTTIPPVASPTTPSQEPTVEPSENAPEGTEPPKGGDGKPAPTSMPTNEEPPATQFLKRWGKQFPGVEEATIMSTAAVVCDNIKDYPNWENSSDFTTRVQNTMTEAGFKGVSTETAASFAVDANQNVCSVVS